MKRPLLAAVTAVWAVSAWAFMAGAEPAASEADLRAQQAAVAFRQGQMSEALRLYGAALQDASISTERRAAILTDRGVVRERAGRIAEAVEDFNKAIKLFPEFAAVYNNRGALLVRVGAYDEALKDFNRALQLAPGYVAAYSNRAGALLKLGQAGAAVEAYTRAIRLAPRIVEPLAGRAGAYVQLERPRAALRDLTRAIANDARFALGYRQRAEAYLTLRDYAAAAADLSRAIAFDPTNAEFYLLRGRAYLAGKDPAAAERDFTKAMELSPNLAEAHLERGHAGILVENFEQAEDDLARALELKPRTALGYAYRALMYKKLGQPELGGPEVSKALLLDKTDARVFWAKGEIDEAMARPAEAADAYRRALAIDPQMQNAIYGLKRLGEDVADETEELPELSFDVWRVMGSRSGYFATNDELGDLRVPLEVAGEGSPRLLDWQMQEGEFAHIGLLRFSAGRIQIDGKDADYEFIAIIDTRGERLVGVEPHRRGERVSKWSWGSGRVIVAAIDGLTQEYMLDASKTNSSTPTAARSNRRTRRKRADSGTPDWAPWAQNNRSATSRSARSRSRNRRRTRQRKPKTLFDLLLGN